MYQLESKYNSDTRCLYIIWSKTGKRHMNTIYPIDGLVQRLQFIHCKRIEDIAVLP